MKFTDPSGYVNVGHDKYTMVGAQSALGNDYSYHGQMERMSMVNHELEWLKTDIFWNFMDLLESFGGAGGGGAWSAGGLAIGGNVASGQTSGGTSVGVDEKMTDFVNIPTKIVLSDKREVTVTFHYTSSDGKNGNQLIRSRTLEVLTEALLLSPDIYSIDISASTNGNHKDPRHKEGLALDIDIINGTPIKSMQTNPIISNFQKALEKSPYHYQNFGPKYNFYSGHQNHIHFSIDRY